MEYDDGRIQADGRGLVIRWYSPLGHKRVAYGDIERVVRRRNTWSRYRIWGSSDFRHWYNLDSTRPGKEVALMLDLGRFARPVLTPDHPDRLVDVLRRHGVDVEDA
jgi:hypothetical protein